MRGDPNLGEPNVSKALLVISNSLHMQEKCVGSLKIKLYVQCTHNLINYGGEVSQLKRNLSQ